MGRWAQYRHRGRGQDVVAPSVLPAPGDGDWDVEMDGEFVQVQYTGTPLAGAEGLVWEASTDPDDIAANDGSQVGFDAINTIDIEVLETGYVRIAYADSDGNQNGEWSTVKNVTRVV